MRAHHSQYNSSEKHEVDVVIAVVILAALSSPFPLKREHGSANSPRESMRRAERMCLHIGHIMWCSGTVLLLVCEIGRSRSEHSRTATMRNDRLCCTIKCVEEDEELL